MAILKLVSLRSLEHDENLLAITRNAPEADRAEVALRRVRFEAQKIVLAKLSKLGFARNQYDGRTVTGEPVAAFDGFVKKSKSGWQTVSFAEAAAIANLTETEIATLTEDWGD